MPNVGGAVLSFEIAPDSNGGARITQTIREHYRFPIDLVMRYWLGFSETSARIQFEAGLQRLKQVLDQQAYGQ